MEDSPREALGQLARLLAAQLDWQRELGLEDAPAPVLTASGAPATSVPSSGPANDRSDETDTSAPVASVASTVRFEIPGFLKKRPSAEPRPASVLREPVSLPTAGATSVPTPLAPSPSGSEGVADRSLPTPTPSPPTPSPLAPEVSRPLFADASLVESSRGFETTALEGEARRAALRVLSDRVQGCAACRLHEGRTRTVFERGSPFAPLAFVGEGPGRDEDFQGKPFVGAAGQLLDKIIAAMGLADDEVYICNVVKCRPPNNRVPAPDEMAACGGYLVAQLDAVRPQYIVALGKTAAGYLLGSTDSMTRMRGRWHQWRGIPLLATWHPAYLLRQPAAKKDTWDDMKIVLERMGRSLPARR